MEDKKQITDNEQKELSSTEKQNLGSDSEKMKKNKFPVWLAILLTVIVGGFILFIMFAMVFLVSLNSARTNARLDGVENMLNAINTMADLCINDGGQIQKPKSVTMGGGLLCSKSSLVETVYPALNKTKLGDAPLEYIETNNKIISVGVDGVPIITCQIGKTGCMKEKTH